MRPHAVGSACHRVQITLDEAMMEGELRLSPELQAHAARCGRCGPQWRGTEALLLRLREGAARIDLGPVPQVVDRVVAVTAASNSNAPLERSLQATVVYRAETSSQGGHWRWILGQLAVVATVIAIAVSTLAYTALKVNQVLTGTRPGEVVMKLGVPFKDWTFARFRNTR